MKTKLFKIYLLPAMIFIANATQAQQAVAVAGGNATGSGGLVSYTVGQVCYTSVSGSNGIITQGVQQPFEISVISAIQTDESIDLQCKVYPNPVSYFMCLTIEVSQLQDFFYQLYDSNGKIIEQQNITGNATEIDLTALAPAVYYLKINKKNHELKTFKIIKN